MSNPPLPPQQPGSYQPGQQPGFEQPGQQPGSGQLRRRPLPPSPFGLPGMPPARSRKGLWLVLGIVAGVLLLVVVGVLLLVNLVGGATRQAGDLADSFTKLVIAGDTDKAYNDYMDPSLKEQLTRDEFASGVKSLQLDPSCTTAYDDLKVSTQNGSNIADVAGLIKCEGKDIELVYRFAGKDELKLVTIRLRPKT
ncbi:hypothetical protein QFZ23_001623 [Arthrobacter globiformis]|uniref:hypothetical protein n=1 Tax=Arthrobacter globiformis TaxID=1665 RepID=UPI002781D2DA|nr:hypothetical protein [Arthrobacter globiformis]MDQ1057722.1 hypothetical protein [Arthrobacter globiformis]